MNNHQQIELTAENLARSLGKHRKSYRAPQGGSYQLSRAEGEIRDVILGFRHELEDARLSLERTTPDDYTELCHSAKRLRDTIDNMRFIKITRRILDVSRMEVFLNHWKQNRPHHNYIPDDIWEDIDFILARWGKQDFETNPLANLRLAGCNWRLQPGIKSRRADVIGHNGIFVNQCWPTMPAAVRDGVHGNAIYGVYGNFDLGCCSIMMADSLYKDTDQLNRIFYNTGNRGDVTMTPKTKILERSRSQGTFVRVLRLHGCSEYAPVCGARYDGLYRVTDCVVRPDGIPYQFQLDRVAGQPDIRWDGPMRRPTGIEQRHWLKIYQDRNTVPSWKVQDWSELSVM